MAHVSAAFVALAIVASAAQLNPWNLPATAEYPDRFEGLISPQVANPRFELPVVHRRRRTDSADTTEHQGRFLPSARRSRCGSGLRS